MCVLYIMTQVIGWKIEIHKLADETCSPDSHESESISF